MNVLFISDPATYPDPEGDIALLYRRAAGDARLNLFHLPTEDATGGDTVQVAPVPRGLDHDGFLDLSNRATTRLPIGAFDIVHCRTLKPFPRGYLDRLGAWTDRTRFLNDPQQKKDQVTPGFLAQVAGGWTPDMITTADRDAIAAFQARHGAVVAKRANSCGGRGVFKLWKDGPVAFTDNVVEGTRRFDDIARAIVQQQPRALLEVVRFLPGHVHGDKRVVVIGGEIYGAYIRRAASGWVHNVSAGAGECLPAGVGPRERAAIAATLPRYQARGLHTLGYDFLMDDDDWRISEINVGNIGGVARLERLTGAPLMDRFINWMVGFAATAARPGLHLAA